MVTSLPEIVWTRDDPSSDKDGISERGYGDNNTGSSRPVTWPSWHNEPLGPVVPNIERVRPR